MIQTSGCDKYFQRIITSFYSSQDITNVTTLLSQIIHTSYKDLATSPPNLEDLYKSINSSNSQAENLDLIYDNAHNNNDYKNIFEKIFAGTPIEELPVAVPRLHRLSYQLKLEEKTGYIYEVVASHWSENYEIAYEWKVDGITTSHDASWTYTPHANTPNKQQITLLIGKKTAGSDSPDTNFLYHEFNWMIEVENTFPTMAPTLKLASTSRDPSNTQNIDFELDTNDACETFSNFSISETLQDPQTLDFNRSCSDTYFPTTITGVDGVINFYIWSKDIEGRISQFPTQKSIFLDRVSPVLNFRDIKSHYDADSSFDISWDLTELNSTSSQFFHFEFYNGSSWVHLDNTPLTNGPHLNGIFTSQLVTPSLNIPNAKMRLTYSDPALNETIIETPEFQVIRPSLSSNPLSISFPDNYNLTPLNTMTVDFTNSSIVNSKACTAPIITGPHAADFSVISNACLLSPILANSTCPMTINVSPTAKGLREASIELVCGKESHSIPLSMNSLNNPPLVAPNFIINIRDGELHAFSIPEGSDLDNPLSDLVYQITKLPTIGTISSCSAQSSASSDRTCSYIAPINYQGTQTIEYVISDGENQSTVGLITINVVDQTATTPVLAEHNFTSGGYVTTSPLTFTSSSCDDIEKIIIQESSVAPTTASSGWQTCSTAAGAINFSPALSNQQGSRTVYAFAQDARFNNITFIDHGAGDNVITYDQSELVLREIRPNETSSQVIHLAGNGQTAAINLAAPAASQSLNEAGWHQTGTFVTNPNDGSVYFSCRTLHICKLNRSTGLWEIYAGTSAGAATSAWWNHGTFPSQTMNLGSQYTTTLLAYAAGKFVTGHYIWNGTYRTGDYSTIRETNEASRESTFLAGKQEIDYLSGCPNGVGSNCNLSAQRSSGQAITYHTPSSSWLYEYSNTKKVMIVKPNAGGTGNISVFADFSDNGLSSMLWKNDYLFYCDDYGVLKKIDYTDPLNPLEYVLPFPGNGIQCAGKRILWKNASGDKPNRLVFPFIQNGLMGVGEYWNP